jgi:hypothetical protein
MSGQKPRHPSGWFNADVDLSFGDDLSPPTSCCFCDSGNPQWRWAVEPYDYPLPSLIQADGPSMVQRGLWTSRVWLACGSCARLERQARYADLIRRAVASRLGRTGPIWPDEEVACIAEPFAAARAAFIGDPELLPPDWR